MGHRSSRPNRDASAELQTKIRCHKSLSNGNTTLQAYTSDCEWANGRLDVNVGQGVKYVAFSSHMPMTWQTRLGPRATISWGILSVTSPLSSVNPAQASGVS